MSAKNETRVRLLIITPTLEGGGSEKFVSQICEHVNTNIFSVCLVVLNNANSFYKIENPAIEIIDLGKNRVLFSLSAIKKVVNKFNPDIIFSTANHLNLYLAIFKNRFSNKIKFVAREASIVSINSKQAKLPFLYNRLIKKYYSRFDMIVCQSAYMQHDLVTYYRVPAEKTMVVQNATTEVLPTTTQPAKQNNQHVYTFITVARLSKEKGIGRLIHAVGLLSVSFKYYIIGEGSKRNELQQLIDTLQLQDKVFLSGEKKSPFSGLEDADLFLMGSYYEGFPNVLLEAGAHGIPVVAFNAPGGIAEIIRENENGLLVEDNNLIAFATTIKKALDNNFDRGQIIATTKKRFSVSSMMTAVENIFLKLAQNK
jgi:glycosyltransferase involved in cell wall biosynthesis